MVCRAIGTGSIPVPGVPVAYEVERTFDSVRRWFDSIQAYAQVAERLMRRF